MMSHKIYIQNMPCWKQLSKCKKTKMKTQLFTWELGGGCRRGEDFPVIEKLVISSVEQSRIVCKDCNLRIYIFRRCLRIILDVKDNNIRMFLWRSMRTNCICKNIQITLSCYCVAEKSLGSRGYVKWFCKSARIGLAIELAWFLNAIHVFAYFVNYMPANLSTTLPNFTLMLRRQYCYYSIPFLMNSHGTWVYVVLWVRMLWTAGAIVMVCCFIHSHSHSAIFLIVDHTTFRSVHWCYQSQYNLLELHNHLVILK